ncbi:MAG TPA: ATP-binding protein [Actinomycetota bacterium]|nr:ATP-binding protein [Actinomycetota bacterium]
MSDSPWLEANQRHLVAAIAVVRRVLERRVESDANAGPEAEARGSMEEAREAMPGPPAVDLLCETFGLSGFERDVLLLCAGVELDSDLGSLCAAAQGDAARTLPTFGLAMAALPDPHWSALTPEAPLRRWRLIDLGDAGPLTLRSLWIDERILHYLTGVQHLDERLSGSVRPLPVPREVSAPERSLAERIAAVWKDGDERSPRVLRLGGGDPDARRAVAAAAAASVGLLTLEVDGRSLPADPHEIEALARLCDREAALSAAALLVEAEDRAEQEAASRFLDRLGAPAIISATHPSHTGRRPAIGFEMKEATAAEQRSAWRRALGAAASSLDGDLDPLVAQFSLRPEAIRAASASALADGAIDGEHPLASALWDAARREARPQLDGLAQRLEPTVTRDDLVLPTAQAQVLREMAMHVRHRMRVHEDWGFRRRSSRGLGISALFAGPSGTGKTMAAEALANELRLDLYRIDLSQVVSKYIGETEKNLARVFDAAERGGAVLLFDEAEALFGRRTEVRDSHDRYANIEVGYLLQRMEAYRGLAILTTNMKESLDHAFLRRIRFVVHFPFPDAEHRTEIWRRIFPPETPTEALDAERLGALSVTGGTIRNIAVHAAFLAADEGAPVRMDHLRRAARGEFTKLERPLSEAEVAGWR